MALKGVAAAKQFHDENTGLPYHLFQLKNDGDSKTVRVLQPESEWLSLFMHRDWESKMPETRCAAEQDDENPMEACQLCAHGIDRSLKTFIPVRVRNDENEKRVCMVVYGRNNLMAVIAQIEELPEGMDITGLDFKIKRQGSKTDTKYWWVATGNQRPLNEQEKALEVPNIDELVKVPTPERLKLILAKIKGQTDEDTPSENGGAKIPF